MTNLFAGITLETLQTRLVAAQTAYDQVCRGEKPSSIGTGDKNLGFAATSKDRLALYIAELQQAIALLENPAQRRSSYAVARFLE